MEQDSFTLIFAITTFILISLNVIKLKSEVKGTWSVLSLSVLITLTFFFVTVPLICVIPIFWSYKHFVKWYLKIKHGSQFIGLIDGSDVTYAHNDKKDSIIMALFMFEVDANKTPNDVYKSIRNMINKHFMGNKEKLIKFHSVLQYYGGYMYMLRENTTQDDFVRKMKTINNSNEITKEELMCLMNDYKNAKFLKNDKLLWDVIVGTQSVKWQAKTGLKYYPVLFRVHHGICDGFSFEELLFGVVSDKGNDQKNNRDTYLSKTRSDPLLTIAYNVVISLYSIIYSPTMLLMEHIVTKKESNILDVKKLSKISVLCAKVDDGKYFNIIKSIKSLFPGVNFSDIILAALSYGFLEYFNKNKANSPKYIRLILPFLRKAMYLPQLPIGELTVDDVSLQNTFDLLSLELPVNIESPDKRLPLQQRLKAVKTQTQKMAQSTTNKVLHFATHLMLQIFPMRMLKYALSRFEWAGILSIIPAPSHITMANGVLKLQDVVVWVPHINEIGCNFAVSSFGRKLQIGLNVDSALIPNEADAEIILDGIFKYLDLLENEIDTMKQF